MVFLDFGGYNHQNPAWAFADAGHAVYQPLVMTHTAIHRLSRGTVAQCISQHKP